MVETSPYIWKIQSSSLLVAQERFIDSLAAIKELADFAVEHVATLDKKGFSITVSSALLDDFDTETRATIVNYLGESVSAIAPVWETGQGLNLEGRIDFESEAGQTLKQS
jgi:hypothetical protein